MPFDSEKRSKEAKKRLRDKSGHFVSLKPRVKLAGQADLLSKLVTTSEGKDESSILSVTLRDPFQKVIQILKDIRDKQSTRVNLSLTIPLVALPIVILLAFQFGRYQSTCSPYFTSQSGTLHRVTIEKTVAPDNWFLKALTYLPFLSDAYNKKEPFPQPVLIAEGKEDIVINNEADADLDAFVQSNVLIFGEYNSCSKTLNLDSAQNISNL